MIRYWHHVKMWECVKAGMYKSLPPSGMNAERARQAYAVFLADSARFRAALERVLVEWPISCQQFLSNEKINRIAWLGQASMCLETGVPCKFRSGFMLLTDLQQAEANAIADEALQVWLRRGQVDRQLDLPDPERPLRGIVEKVGWYAFWWSRRGYRKGLPEEVQGELSDKQLVPSWRAVAVAILSNDVPLQSLGFYGPSSEWYSILKRAELAERGSL